MASNLSFSWSRCLIQKCGDQNQEWRLFFFIRSVYVRHSKEVAALIEEAASRAR